MMIAFSMKTLAQDLLKIEMSFPAYISPPSFIKIIESWILKTISMVSKIEENRNGAKLILEYNELLSKVALTGHYIVYGTTVLPFENLQFVSEKLTRIQFSMNFYSLLVDHRRIIFKLFVALKSSIIGL